MRTISLPSRRFVIRRLVLGVGLVALALATALPATAANPAGGSTAAPETNGVVPVLRKKRAHLVPFVVEDQALPLRVKTLARVCVLIEAGAIEAREPMRVIGKMGGHPINKHTNTCIVQCINHRCKILWRTKA